MEKEEKYWREVLRRVVSTIKLLGRLGIAFRGHDESEQSNRKGNYLSCLEYLNSTPDIAHIDQLTFVIRYVSFSGKIFERILGFIPMDRHNASYLEQEVLEKLEKLGLNIAHCRGQSFDNASNMSGKYMGLQARIKQHSPSAVCIPCANHSLNLTTFELIFQRLKKELRSCPICLHCLPKKNEHASENCSLMNLVKMSINLQTEMILSLIHFMPYAIIYKRNLHKGQKNMKLY
uniref:Uncharacterized protein n=1 Tax=Anopheles arabiensis TaxID=7173 RepID=A0A182I5D1_ANOAR